MTREEREALEKRRTESWARFLGTSAAAQATGQLPGRQTPTTFKDRAAFEDGPSMPVVQAQCSQRELEWILPELTTEPSPPNEERALAQVVADLSLVGVGNAFSPTEIRVAHVGRINLVKDLMNPGVTHIYRTYVQGEGAISSANRKSLAKVIKASPKNP
jgi:hypothetical protein